MRKNLLNKAQVRWLYSNYREKSNQELAQELTKMVLEENEKELKECKEKLVEAWSYKEKDRLLSRIRVLNKFKGISVSYLKRKAREIGCHGKSSRRISRNNSAKASRTHWKKLKETAEVVTSPYEWFDTFKLNEKRIAMLETEKRYNSMRNSICNWNREHGEAKGMILVPHWNKEVLGVRIIAKSLYK